MHIYKSLVHMDVHSSQRTTLSYGQRSENAPPRPRTRIRGTRLQRTGLMTADRQKKGG